MIEQLTIDGLSDERLLKLGGRFYREARLPGSFIPEVFVNTWTTLLRMTVGAVWVATVDKEPVGALGAVVHPDANDGKIVAQEMFWFMDPAFRDGFNAIKLYNKYEEWARARGASRIVMGCILGPYATALRKFYTKLGYRPVDVSYFKQL